MIVLRARGSTQPQNWRRDSDSGETADVSIADLAVAWNAAMIKAGIRGGGRIPKLNELIRIEQAVAGIKLASFSIR